MFSSLELDAGRHVAAFCATLALDFRTGSPTNLSAFAKETVNAAMKAMATILFMFFMIVVFLRFIYFLPVD